MVVQMVPQEETRQGFIFTTEVATQKSGNIQVRLLVKGQEKPVCSLEIDPLEAWLNGEGNPETAVSMALAEFISSGLFYETVEDPSLLAVLINVQREQREKVVWYKRVFRFLKTIDSFSPYNPKFILTPDKSDLPEEERQLLRAH